MIITVEERITRRHAFYLPDEEFDATEAKDFIRRGITDHGIGDFSRIAPITRTIDISVYMENDSQFSELIDIEYRNEWFTDDDQLEAEMASMTEHIEVNMECLKNLKAKYNIGQEDNTK